MCASSYITCFTKCSITNTIFQNFPLVERENYCEINVIIFQCLLRQQLMTITATNKIARSSHGREEKRVTNGVADYLVVRQNKRANWLDLLI